MPDFHKFTLDRDGWETLASRVTYANDYLEVRQVEVRTPGRSEPRSWTVVHRKGAVVVAPVTEDGRILLVRQERVPVRRALWELPAGQIEESEEHSEEIIHATALRELREETGYELAEGGRLTSLGYFFPSAGFTDEHSHLFLARPVIPSPNGHRHDCNEVITECRAFTIDQWRDMIVSGEVCDANTLSAFARLNALNPIGA